MERKLVGEKDIESVLQRLDRLTLEESELSAEHRSDARRRLWSCRRHGGDGRCACRI